MNTRLHRVGELALLAWSLSVAGGCVPKVHLTVLDAAEVVVPPEIHRIAVVTDPNAELDPVVDGLRARLAASGRFQVADLLSGEAPPDAVITIRGLATATEITEQTRAVPVKAPAAPASDGAAGPDGAGEGAVPGAVVGVTVGAVVEATRTSKITVTWDLKTRDGAVVDHLDDVAVIDQWTAEGPTSEAARAALLPEDEAVRELSWSAGAAYARRIASLEDDVVRSLVVGGDPALRSGAKAAATAGDWNKARAEWIQLANRTTDAAVRARAWYDLAVADEVEGEYRRALGQLDQAIAIDDDPRFPAYRAEVARAWAMRRDLVRVAADAAQVDPDPADSPTEAPEVPADRPAPDLQADGGAPSLPPDAHP